MWLFLRNENWYFDRHFEWQFLFYGMVTVWYENSYGKVLFLILNQNGPPFSRAQTGVKSSLDTIFKSVKG